jgi:hypothetical protein
MPLTMKGRTGRLLWGSRVVTEFAAWQASATGPGTLRVDVARHEPDPAYWAYHDGDLTAELELGKMADRGRVELLSTEPLQFILHEQQDGET